MIIILPQWSEPRSCYGGSHLVGWQTDSAWCGFNKLAGRRSWVTLVMFDSLVSLPAWENVGRERRGDDDTVSCRGGNGGDVWMHNTIQTRCLAKLDVVRGLSAHVLV